MRKYIVIFLILNLGMNFLIAQTEKNIGDLPEPVASVSSFSTYTNTPVNLSTGVPDINIPLYNLETNNKSISVPVLLNYHPHNATETSMGSDVGLGWSLFNGGIISRKIIEELDERLDNASLAYYQKNEFDDIYYYNIPGYSGKFKFIRDTTNNTFTLKHLTNNKLKIEYTRTSNTATLILQSFTITDDRGVKYIFEDYSTALRNRPFGTNQLSVYYKSAFYLSKIIDENNLEQVKFTYQKKSKYSDGSNGVAIHLIYEVLKPILIESSFGKINFEYSYNQNFEYEYDNDPYSVTSVSLLNKQSVIISKYNFLYDSFISSFNSGKRILTTLNKVNNLSQIIENRKFEYDTSGSTTSYNYYTSGDPCGDITYKHPSTFTIGVLKKIILPSKGSIVYNFEAGEVYADKSNYVPSKFYINDPAIEYFYSYNISFDTSQTKVYNLQINVPRRIHIYFAEETNNNPIFTPNKPDLEPYQAPLSFAFKNNAGQEIQPFSCTYFDPHPPTKYELEPGNYTLNVVGSGTGYFTIYQIEAFPAPYKNANYSNNIRIKNIKFYDADGTLKNSQNYSYDLFNNSLNPSVDGLGGGIYKNIKVTSNNGYNGYTKYYFKNITDFPSTTSDYSYSPYYENIKDGVLYKVENYDYHNNLVRNTDINYTFEELPNSATYFIDEELESGKYTKPSYLKNKIETVKEFYANNSSLQKTIETNYNINNYEVSSTKETAPDGTVTEGLIKYAQDLSKTNMINANVISVPIEIETKVNNKTLSKTETKYDNTSNFFVTSVLSTNPNDTSTKTAVKNDIYDTKGNLVQYTTDYDANTGIGNSVTIIWGYNQTLPIAKIEGAKLSDIGTLADDIITKSNADIDTATENTLITALDTFRNQTTLKNFFITTYTYNPLIGVTTITPPNGMREFYRYDANNRLQSVVDTNGNIIKEMKYNNKQ